MKNKSCIFASVFAFPRAMIAISALLLAACAGSANNGGQNAPVATPTVDYVESLDVYSAPHKDSFLNQLAMNYRSYAVYNARASGYSDIGELFAQKAVAAFSGETPFPETLDNWPVDDDELGFELHNSYNSLLDGLKNDAIDNNPEVAAEAQAKFDCWLSASASGQAETANECKTRFEKAMAALICDGKTVGQTNVQTQVVATTVSTAEKVKTQRVKTEAYYPETRRMAAMNGAGHARDGVIIVNNVNIPKHLINPVPVHPMVFNQNIYEGDKAGFGKKCGQSGECPQQPRSVMGGVETAEESQIPMLGEELVTREEFINMMMAMRSELAAINARLDKIQAAQGDRTMIKVQQIPLEPKQHVMEEIFEIRFDFNKSDIKPEYQDLVRKLATATQENKNIKVSVIGHTDTVGSAAYNYALGGQRAEAVQKMLVQYGIPASQIVSVSAGEKDNKLPTGDNVKNAENRRVRVVKEIHYTETPKPVPMAIEVEEYTAADCGMYGCDQ
jgi:outer membrane protein OmpA-like peptidoglycan-associated protein